MSIHDSLKKSISEEARKLIVDATYTGRNHQTMGLWMSRMNTYLGVPAIVLSAVLSSAAGVNALLNKNHIITAILALVATALTALRGFLRADKLAEDHALKGDRFISLRNDTRLFRNVEMLHLANSDEMTHRIKGLRKRYNDLNETAPRHIYRLVFNAVRRGIKDGESDYIDDPIWIKEGD